MNTLIFVLYAVAIAVASLSPSSGVSGEHWDKVIHCMTYAVFAGLGYRVVKEGRAYFLLCFGIIVYSGLIEVGQSFMPGRVMSGYDLLANAVGVAVGAVVIRRFLESPGSLQDR